jgi:hypothetical protein
MKQDKAAYLQELRQFFAEHPIPKGTRIRAGVILDPQKFLGSHFSTIEQSTKPQVIKPYLNRLLAVRSQLSSEVPTFEHGYQNLEAIQDRSAMAFNPPG